MKEYCMKKVITNLEFESEGVDCKDASNLKAQKG